MRCYEYLFVKKIKIVSQFKFANQVAILYIQMLQKNENKILSTFRQCFGSRFVSYGSGYWIFSPIRIPDPDPGNKKQTFSKQKQNLINFCFQPKK